jgi:GT2 family glycosyltransferase/glycosyltransferase involved in cell wall biosynthesis
MHLLKVLFLHCRNGLDDIAFWIKYRGIRSETRRFFGLQRGYLSLMALDALRRVLPAAIYHGLLARFFKKFRLFDADYYLRTNDDVTLAGLNPLLHYLQYGDAEGRFPNPLFDPRFYSAKANISRKDVNSLLHYCIIGRYLKVSPSAWFDTFYYLQHNRDVAREVLDPLLHYILWGGLEGRSPNPSFDGSYYLRTYPDVKQLCINPLLHYIQFGRLEGRLTRPMQLDSDAEVNAEKYELIAKVLGEKWEQPGEWGELEQKLRPQVGEPRVAILIPVYRNRLLTWRCLASVFTASCGVPFRIIVVDDASPEPELSSDLDQMASRGWIELLRNQDNQGFVYSVNRALELAHGTDVILLNSDTEVYDDWLDRLHRAAWRNPHTASVTPLSNSATICSYPRFLHDNPYPLEVDYSTLDRLAAQVNAGNEFEAPTGVGFCMYLRHDALSQIGLFDEKVFGRGYGEENDWSQRAIAKGWRNIIVTDTFVRHFGSASFQGEKAQRVAHAMNMLNARYPDYHQQVQNFIKHDPLYPCRERLDWARLKNQICEKNVLIVCHSRGGGAERHVQEDTLRMLDAGYGVFYLRPVRGVPSQVRFAHPRCRQLLHSPTCHIGDAKALAAAMIELQITSIHFHGLVDMIPDAAGFISDVAHQLKIPVDIDIHDYKAICPRINLADSQGFYCGEPDENTCNHCLVTSGNDFGVTHIQPWREMHHRVLRAARNVWVPDDDVSNRLAKYFPDVPMYVAPHEEISSFKLTSQKYKQINKPLHIVVIGAISRIKGYDILLACANLAKVRNLPVRFSVLGYSMNDSVLEAAGVQVTGRYCDSSAEELLHDLEPDLVWLPSVWPETYSYTLSIALKAGYPTFVFDIGAPAARLRRQGFESWVMPFEQAKNPEAVLNFFMQ